MLIGSTIVPEMAHAMLKPEMLPGDFLCTNREHPSLRKIP